MGEIKENKAIEPLQNATEVLSIKKKGCRTFIKDFGFSRVTKKAGKQQMQKKLFTILLFHFFLVGMLCFSRFSALFFINFLNIIYFLILSIQQIIISMEILHHIYSELWKTILNLKYAVYQNLLEPQNFYQSGFRSLISRNFSETHYQLTYPIFHIKKKVKCNILVNNFHKSLVDK